MGTDLSAPFAVYPSISALNQHKSWLFYCAVWWPARPVWCPQQPCSAHPATTAPSSARTVSAVTLPTRCRKDTLTPPFHLLSSTWLTPSPSPTKCPPSQPPPS